MESNSLLNLRENSREEVCFPYFYTLLLNSPPPVSVFLKLFGSFWPLQKSGAPKFAFLKALELLQRGEAPGAAQFLMGAPAGACRLSRDVASQCPTAPAAQQAWTWPPSPRAASAWPPNHAQRHGRSNCRATPRNLGQAPVSGAGVGSAAGACTGGVPAPSGLGPTPGHGGRAAETPAGSDKPEPDTRSSQRCLLPAR